MKMFKRFNKLESQKTKLLNNFQEQFQFLKTTVDEYQQQHATLAQSQKETPFHKAILVAQEEILENSAYSMLNYGSPESQLQTIERMMEHLGTPLFPRGIHQSWTSRFDYEEAYPLLSPMIKERVIDQEQFDEYVLLADIFKLDMCIDEYEKGFKPREEKDLEHNYVRHLFRGNYRQDEAFELGQKHFEKNNHQYKNAIDQNVVKRSSYTRPEFAEDWKEENNHIRANAVAKMFLQDCAKAYQSSLKTMDGILEDSLAHLEAMINEIKEAIIPAKAALEEIEMRLKHLDEDRDFEALDEDGERQAMLNQIYRVK